MPLKQDLLLGPWLFYHLEVPLHLPGRLLYSLPLSLLQGKECSRRAVLPSIWGAVRSSLLRHQHGHKSPVVAILSPIIPGSFFCSFNMAQFFTFIQYRFTNHSLLVKYSHKAISYCGCFYCKLCCVVFLHLLNILNCLNSKTVSHCNE